MAVMPTGIGADAAGHVYVMFDDYTGSEPQYGTAYISPLPPTIANAVVGPINPAYLLPSFAAYGNANLAYGVDTVLFENSTRPGCQIVNDAYYPSMVANSGGTVYFIYGGPTETGPESIVSLNPGTPISAGNCTSTTVVDGSTAGLVKASALVIDSAGNVYIWDHNPDIGQRIQMLNPVTQALTTVALPICGNKYDATSMAVASGILYYTDGVGVYQMNLATGGCGTVNIPNLGTPVGVAVDSNGNLYVADSSKNQVIQLSGMSGVQCSGLNPIYGSCGPAADFLTTTPPSSALCHSGAASALSGSVPGPWTWACSGTNYGANAYCGTYPAALTVSASAPCPWEARPPTRPSTPGLSTAILRPMRSTARRRSRRRPRQPALRATTPSP
jgi:hypothetical protein